MALGLMVSTEASAQALRVENHHEMAYQGPVEASVSLPDGTYRGVASRGEVRSGQARVLTSLPAGVGVELTRTGALGGSVFEAGAFDVDPSRTALRLSWAGRAVGSLELGLAVIPGKAGTAPDAVRAFRPLTLAWREGDGGVLLAEAERDGYRVLLEAKPYASGWLDLQARLTRVGGSDAPAYVALVRRVTTPGIGSGSQQLNGRVLDGLTTPDIWSVDFRYVHGTDWLSWKAGPLAVLAVNGFTPVPTVLRENGAWGEGSHWWVWERSHREGDQLYMLSEIESANEHQSTRGANGVNPYAALRVGDTVSLKYRLALSEKPGADWEEANWRVFAGYRMASAGASSATIDLGVPAVTFGTAYFPYSTLTENFDYYRVVGLDKETYWPFSPTMWRQWRKFIPRMRTDMRILSAMGFQMVRLHHLEMLQTMDRAEAVAFLDFYMDEARTLGLKVMLDTEGPAEWVTLLAQRYGDVVTRYEIENEVVIGGVRPGYAERWTSLYHSARAADPGSQIFFTGAGNNGQFERMRALGVPFDRVGLHAYKHGPEWIEAFASHPLGTAGYAADLGKAVTLGEFNWKELTRLSPEERRDSVERIYAQVLRTRSIPELVQFHLQEMLSVNPSIQRQGIRHYEPLHLDRRPKLEGVTLMDAIRRYSAADAPIRELPVAVSEVSVADGSATASFRITNLTDRTVSLHLTTEAYGGLETKLIGADARTLAPGASTTGSIEVGLPAEARPGTYHHFLRVEYDGKTAWGWGIAANAGSPDFAASVIPEKVVYPQGADVVESIDWARPLAVAFGPEASVLEVESAYLVGETLQAATGRKVRISSTADLAPATAARGTVILVGTAATNPLIGTVPGGAAGEKGVIYLRSEAGRQQLILTGADKAAVEAAAGEFVLRYWKNAKDSAIRLAGMEKGAALGNKAGVTAIDLP